MFAKLASIVALFAVAAQATIIIPLANPVSNADFEPTITSPTASTVWTIGQQVNVTWETSNFPPFEKNATGLLLLGFEANDSENLNGQDPLASNFPLETGFVTVTVPDVTPGDNYIAVLFGNSGNASPEFTIQA